MYKKLFPILLCGMFFSARLWAQNIKEIYVNLYTDSLKRGTYNYINIDGKLANGKYMPLDSNYISFTSSYGKFYGNSLFIDKNSEVSHVKISVVFKPNPALHKEFLIWIKTTEDDSPLPTNQEILDRIKNEQRSSHQKNA